MTMMPCYPLRCVFVLWQAFTVWWAYTCRVYFAICHSGIFSPTNTSQEIIVGDLIKKNYSDATYTLSHQLGFLGLIERENASILNESVKDLCKKTISGFKTGLAHIGLECPIFFTQNDGTLIRY